MPTINWATLKESAGADIEPVPAGDYIAEITFAEWAKTQKGKDMLRTRLRILAGPQQGKTLFDQQTISPESQIALQIFAKTLATFGVPNVFDYAPDATDTIPSEIIGNYVQVVTEMREYQGEMRSSVKGYSPAPADFKPLPSAEDGGPPPPPVSQVEPF